MGIKILEWNIRDIVCTLSGVFFGEFKRRRPYMLLLRYYVGNLNLSPRWEPRVEDVLSAALSVYEIQNGQDSHGRDVFYIVFSASNFRHVLDVTRVFRANGVVGTLCYTGVENKDGEIERMLALCVRDKGPKYFAQLSWKKTGATDEDLLMLVLPIYVGGQKFIRDVQNVKDNMDYYRSNVLPEYNAARENKKYILPELFGPYSH